MSIKPYDTAKLFKEYLLKNNKSELKFFFEPPFDSKEQQENLKFLAQIKVLKTNDTFSYFKPTKSFNFYLFFHISPYQLLNFYFFIKELISNFK